MFKSVLFFLHLICIAVLMAIGKQVKKLFNKPSQRGETSQSMTSTGAWPSLGMIVYGRFPAFCVLTYPERVDQELAPDGVLFDQGRLLGSYGNGYKANFFG